MHVAQNAFRKGANIVGTFCVLTFCHLADLLHASILLTCSPGRPVRAHKVVDMAQGGPGLEAQGKP